jgi:hypothetical protein
MKYPFALSFPIDFLNGRYHIFAKLVDISKSFINLRPVDARCYVEARSHLVLDECI